MPEVLLVDPEVEVAPEELEKRGWNVLPATSVASCMRLARQERPDLAVVASNLPDGSGVQLVERLRALLRTAVTPIVGIVEGEQEARNLLDAGVQECVQRPLSADRLIATLARHTGEELTFATAPAAVIGDPRRLEVLAATNLLDAVPEEDIDRFTRLASAYLEAPTALVSLVDRDRQVFKSGVGLGTALELERQTPLTHSYCQWAVASQEPFVVADARLDPIVKNNPAIHEYDAVSYCGVPIVVRGEAIGTLCVIDSEPRPWSDEQVVVMKDLGAILSSYIELRLASRPPTP